MTALRTSELASLLVEVLPADGETGKHRKNSLVAWLPDLLGRAAQSSPEAAPRRAKGAGLYGNGADRANLQLPPLPVKSSSRFPDAPTHAQRNGAACRWCDKLAFKQRCARISRRMPPSRFACSPSPPTYPRRPGAGGPQGARLYVQPHP